MSSFSLRETPPAAAVAFTPLSGRFVERLSDIDAVASPDTSSPGMSPIIYQSQKKLCIAMPNWIKRTLNDSQNIRISSSLSTSPVPSPWKPPSSHFLTSSFDNVVLSRVASASNVSVLTELIVNCKVRP